MGTVASIDAIRRIRLQGAVEDRLFNLVCEDDANDGCVVVHVPHDVSRCVDVLFICNEWGSSKGGLSTFNREFAVNLAKASDKIKVHCYVCSSSEQDRDEARKQGVNLITARRVPGSSDPMEALKFSPSDLPHPHIVVGHGRKFGIAAHFIADRAKCWWIQFVHVFCEALGKYKREGGATADAIADNEKKNKQELELCEAADLVVAVGSHLQKKYNRTLPDIKVEAITPGIFEKFVIQSNKSDKFQPSEAEEFSIFMFGRGSFEDFTLKGYDIVGKAVALLGRKFELTFVGSPQDEQRRIEKWFLKKTKILRNQLTIRGYCNYEEMKKMFREADLIVMPSRTEGFGLVALEAISAGIPVLVSAECGIARALKDVEGGMSVVVNSDMPEEWARRIHGLSVLKPEERHACAIYLRKKYGKIYSWPKECEKFQQMIHELVQRPRKAVPLNLLLTDGKMTVKFEAVLSLDDKEVQMNKEGGPVVADSDANTSSQTSSENREADSNREGESATGSKFVGKDGNECDSLHSAARDGDVTKIESLLSLGFSIDSRDDECSHTPLMMAVLNSQVQAVKYLLNKGADVSLEDNLKRSLLHLAAKGGNLAIIRMMLSKRFAMNSKDNKGMTPLMLAAAHDKLRAVKYLLIKGADPSLRSNEGWNLLHWASQADSPAIIELMLSHMLSIDSITNEGATALMLAAGNDKPQAFKFLLEKGADPFLKDRNGLNLLHWASKNNNPAVLKAILSYGVDIESRASLDSDQGAASRDSSEYTQGVCAKDQDENAVSPYPSTNTEVKRNKEGESSTDQSTALKVSLECTREGSETGVQRNKVRTSSTDSDEIGASGTFSECTQEFPTDSDQAPSISLDNKEATNTKKGVLPTDSSENTFSQTSSKTNSDQEGESATGSEFVGKDKNEWNSLHSAAFIGDVTKIETLLSLGFSIDSRDDQDMTPLMYAAAFDKLQAVEYLLGKGADPSLKGNNGWNLLHMASQGGNPVIIELILSHVCSIDSITNKGETALMLAAGNDKLQAVEYLLGKGADPSLKGNNGWNLLHCASQGGNPTIIELMLSHVCSIDSITNKGSTALMIAAVHDKLHAVEYLLGKGADPSLKSNNGWNLLHCASRGGNPVIIELILSHACNIDSITNEGFTALMLAAVHDKLQAVEYLLEKGADASLKSNDGWNSLHRASQGGNPAIIELMLSHVSSTDSITNKGETALMLAAGNGKLQAVEYLLGKGADPSLKDNNGWNSLHRASQGGNPAIIELMLSHACNIDSINNEGVTALMVAAGNDKLQAVEYLLGKGADPSLEDNGGWNSLHHTSYGDNISVIEKILSYGVDIESRTKDGSTPLMIAQACGKAEAVTYLLSKGAKPSY